MDHDPTHPHAGGPAPADGSADPAVDRAGLLERLDGDEAILIEVVKVFLEDAPGQIAGMSAAAASGDRVTLRRLAHTMKGAAGTVGATALQRAALALEHAIDRGDLEEANGLIGAVRDCYAAAERIMAGWLAGGGPS